jgi:hypothetical protein
MRKAGVAFIAQVTWRLNRKKPAPEYSNWFLNSGGEGVEHDHRLTDTPDGDGPKADGTLGWCAPPQTGHRAAQDSEAPPPHRKVTGKMPMGSSWLLPILSAAITFVTSQLSWRSIAWRHCGEYNQRPCSRKNRIQNVVGLA